MKKYFETKIRHQKVTESGREQKVTETYLTEAVNFTDAEETMHRLAEQTGLKQFQVKDIKESNVENVLNIDGDKAFKAKVSTIAIDEEAGREKRFSSYWLVFADDFYEAFKIVNIEMESMVIPAYIISMSESPIVELVEPLVPEPSPGE